MFLLLLLSVFLSRPFHFPRLHWQWPILLHLQEERLQTVQEERLQTGVWTRNPLAEAAVSRLLLWGHPPQHPNRPSFLFLSNRTMREHLFHTATGREHLFHTASRGMRQGSSSTGEQNTV